MCRLMAGQSIESLAAIVRMLRSPHGCLWDRAQTKEDAARYVLEEAYEVIDALENGSAEELKEELGDLLFQIVALSCIAEERGEFSLSDIMNSAGEKMIRRHPHVFGNAKVRSVADIKDNWDAIKKQETGESTYRERFARITKTLPALIRAQKITGEAAKAGFDWQKTDDVLAKVEEELEELKRAIKSCQRERVSDEMGDLLLSLVNLCRFLEIDAEASLRDTLQRFILRFSYIEEELQKAGKQPSDVSLAEMDRLWEEAKMKGTGG
jgi:tetrapyrrole methylase family protein / MazG family protein